MKPSCPGPVAVGALALACTFAFAQQPDADARDSIRFVRPAPRAVITGNSLQIEIEPFVADDSITSIELRSSYFTSGFTTSGFNTFFQSVNDTLLHVMYAPPWQWIWDISTVQDHYHYRMGLSATVRTKRGRTLYRTTGDFVIDRLDTQSRRSLRASRHAPSRAPDLVSSAPAQQFQNGDNTVTFQCFWTAETLFVTVNVDDQSLILADSSESNQDRAWWYGDIVEIYLDPGFLRPQHTDTTTFQILLHPGGHGYGGHNSLIFDPYRFDVPVVSELRADGFDMRAAIAWSSLRFRPRVGARIGFEIVNVDRDRAGGLFSVSSWSGLHMANHHNASDWGELVLSESPEIRTLSIIFGALALVAVVVVALSYHRQRRRIFAAPAVATARPLGPVVSSALAIIAAEYANDTLDLHTVAARLGKNPKYLSSLFKKETGLGFAASINKVRLEHAEQLLRTTDRSISHISLEVGYSSYKYFSAVYRKTFGVSPSDVRRTI